MACSVGVPVCLVLPLQCVLILTHEESRLVPAEMNFNKFPAPSLTCFYFSTPCKGKKFVIQLIPPFLRNSTDPLIPPPWSFKKKNHSNRFQSGLPCFTEVFGHSFACCQIGVRWEGAKCKQHTSSSGSVLQSLRLLCQHTRAGCEQVKNTPAKGKPLCLQSSLISCWGRCCPGDFYAVGSEYVSVPAICRCQISGPKVRMGAQGFYRGHVEIWQWKPSVLLWFHPVRIFNTGILWKLGPNRTIVLILKQIL